MKRAALLFISGCAAVCAAATVPDSVTHRLKPLEVMGVKQRRQELPQKLSPEYRGPTPGASTSTPQKE